MTGLRGGVVYLAAAVLVAVTGDRAARDQGRPNIILIVSDDHRYDFMGFMPQAPGFLETPGFDRMATEGAQALNAFVTTSLCSPSRASILTGRYAHRHGVVDNTSPIPPGTVFFPVALRRAGYRTGFIGKSHMGEDRDDPLPGFEYWAGFKGQGVYQNPTLNVNGRRQEFRGYTTDILTDLALKYLEERVRDRRSGHPFFLILAHKAVHSEFVPAPRHRDRFATAPVRYPPTMTVTPANDGGQPRWVREQRNSWHGVDYMYYGAITFDQFYRRYAETLLALDESVSRVLEYVGQAGLARETVIIYTSDNGFSLGEHGLIDKRQAYEESIRVPMLFWGPGRIPAGARVRPLIRNIDLAPTILELAGVPAPADMDGRTVLPLLLGRADSAPEELLYEYYWEDAFPQTPTVLALRDARYKFIYYHGIWDQNELYDLQADPDERRNLAADSAQKPRVERMRQRLFDRLAEAGGLQIPLRRPTGYQAGERNPSR